MDKDEPCRRTDSARSPWNTGVLRVPEYSEYILRSTLCKFENVQESTYDVSCTNTIALIYRTRVLEYSVRVDYR